MHFKTSNCPWVRTHLVTRPAGQAQHSRVLGLRAQKANSISAHTRAFCTPVCKREIPRTANTATPTSGRVPPGAMSGVEKVE